VADVELEFQKERDEMLESVHVLERQLALQEAMCARHVPPQLRELYDCDAVWVGLGRIVALYHRAFNLYHIH
jgi:hypothetical protein